MSDEPRTTEAASAPDRTSANGRVAPGSAPPAAPTPPVAGRRSGGRRLVLVVLLLVALTGGGIVGYRWWYDSSHFVSTDNAQIAGRLVQVGSLVAGRVAAVRYDVGERVESNEVVATIRVPVPVSATSNGVPRLEYRETDDSIVEVRSPVSGVVVARGANPSDTVPAGQSVLTIVDPRQLWVTANIEETQVRRLQVGQPVRIRVETLDRELAGRVLAITPASAATFSLLPAQNTSGNFTRVTQLVPVKIAFEEPAPDLILGTSVSVRIEVAQP